MCIVKTFCCGCTLRQGAITTAVLNGIVCICLIITGARYVSYDESAVPHGSHKVREAVVTILRTLGGTMLTIAIITLCIFVSLVIGIVKNNANFVMPWLIGCLANMVLSVFLTIYGITKGVSEFGSGIIGIALYIYLWIVIYSYYRELRDVPPIAKTEIKA